MSTSSYTSCIKIGGVPIVPPLVTPQVREECLRYKLKAIEIENKKERDKLFKKCMEDLERLENQTKELTVKTTLEQQLALADESSPSHVPYDTYKKMQNLTSETIDVSEYSVEGCKVLNKSTESEQECSLSPPKLIRSNSYTLESPSPILLAHLEKEARKCIELDDSDSASLSPVTIIDSELEPPLQVVDTDINVQQITVTTPVKFQDNQDSIDPQLLDILSKLPEDHARNILELLSKQHENNKIIKEQIISEEDKSISVSISSQSLYYSTLSPDTTRGSPNELNMVNLRNIKNNNLDQDKAANVIQAGVKGYLVRRLIQTERVQSLIETIKDAILCAVQLHNSDVIEEADVELHRRLIQQVSAACYAFHDIFFTLSVKEQMGIISLDRQRKKEKANRPLSASSSNQSLSRRQSARMIR
ncbi:uncharacterized protein LOC135127949 [Zophobas morio]|uniref:uncharacterized protein LOC135127949 n=1 Tax=Zophobas morio TaxID=2755281 RepID=UPI003083B40C